LPGPHPSAEFSHQRLYKNINGAEGLGIKARGNPAGVTIDTGFIARYVEFMIADRVWDIFDDEDTVSADDYLDGMFCYERVGDAVYMMATSTEEHQDTAIGFISQIRIYLKGNKSKCKVQGMNTGWDLTSYVSELKEKDNLEFFLKKREIEWRAKNVDGNKDKRFPLYLAPDIMVLCDRFEGDWGAEGFKGIPSLIVEVLSKSTFGNDMGWKKDIYEAMGVQEYWIIDILNTFKATRYNLVDGRYIYEEFLFKDVLQFSSQLFPGLILDISDNDLSFFKFMDNLWI
jgi:Uma2 family endonuclease